MKKKHKCFSSSKNRDWPRNKCWENLSIWLYLEIKMQEKLQ
jgi:hypothetical protein